MNIEITGKYIPSTKSVEQLATEAATRATKRLMDKIYGKLKMELQDIYDEEVRKFYDDYDPLYYHRRYSLYRALKISEITSNDIIGIDYSFKSYMTVYSHSGQLDGSLDNSLLELTFGEGYHGGARAMIPWHNKNTGENGIHYTGDTPLWRTPYGGYYSWGRPAYKSDAPYDLFMEKMEKWWTIKTKKYIEPMFVKLFSEEFNK